MLKENYGRVKLKKGSIIYHTSDTKFILKKEKPFLFCVFHPSDWDLSNRYVTFIEIKRDISLFFMIDNIINGRIHSSLTNLTNNKSLNLSKMYNENLLCYENELRKENFDGWFSSIENKTTVEVALLNNKDIYKVLKTEKIIRNVGYNRIENRIENQIINNNKPIQQDGDRYPISIIDKILVFRINHRYKKIIKKYKEYCKELEFSISTIFQMILKYSKFYYHKYKLEKIHWNC